MTTDDTPTRIYLCHNRNGHPRFEEVGPDDIGAEAWVPEGSGVRVKPLEWHNYDVWTFWAESPSGTYHVEERNGGWRVQLRVGGLVHDVLATEDTTPEDLDAAKAAAQADYEARIMAALEPVAQPETPAPGQFETMCLAIEDVISGRGFYVDPWQTIETAPKDGTPFLACWLRTHEDGTRYAATQPYVVAHFHSNSIWPSWISVDDFPTHWMPLPKPPGETTSAIPEAVKAYLRNALMVGGWKGERE